MRSSALATLLKPRWLVAHVVLAAVVLACLSLSAWQWRRHEWRSDRNQQISQGLAAPAQPFERLPAGDRAYRRTMVQGHYLADEHVLLSPRNEHGPGHHVLTPLRLPDGRLLLVDRGWVPFRFSTPPVPGTAPPDGPVALRGVLLPRAQAGAAATADERGRVLRVRAVRPQALLGEQAIDDVYLQLASQQPPAGELPIPAPPPAPDAGPHLSYAVQWLLFAAVAAGGYAMLLRRALRERDPTT